MRIRYTGQIDLLRGEYEVVKVAHNNEKVNAYETNVSGQDIYICESPGGIRWRFLASEIELLGA